MSSKLDEQLKSINGKKLNKVQKKTDPTHTLKNGLNLLLIKIILRTQMLVMVLATQKMMNGSANLRLLSTHKLT
jgi:hypothetical protein